MNMAVLGVAVGGALGSAARYGVGQLAARTLPAAFPWGTFLVNVAGCFLFGLLAGTAALRGTAGQSARLFLLVGFLGGFTTFSTFAFEAVTALRDGQFGLVAVSIGGQVALGLVAVWAGLMLTR